jgi:hypothetical protein
MFAPEAIMAITRVELEHIDHVPDQLSLENYDPGIHGRRFKAT